jgi:hypothetical protein
MMMMMMMTMMKEGEEEGEEGEDKDARSAEPGNQPVVGSGSRQLLLLLRASRNRLRCGRGLGHGTSGNHALDDAAVGVDHVEESASGRAGGRASKQTERASGRLRRETTTPA